MRLYERSGVLWADVYHEGRRLRFSTKQTSKSEAKKLVSQLLVGKVSASELKEKIKTDQQDLAGRSLGKLFNKIMDNEYRDRPALSSIVANNNVVLEYFGKDKDITSITQQELSGFKDWLLQEKRFKSASTRNKKLLALSSLMKTAREHWGMTNVPKLTFKLERAKTQRKFIYTDEQIQLIMAYFKDRGDTFMHDLVLYLSQTGKRLGEALRLNEGDIRMDAGVIDVWESKGDEPRGIPMTAQVKELLITRKNFAGVPAYTIQHRWIAMREATGISKEATLHGLRHTFATRLCEKGVDIQTVQRLLGHKQLTTTTIYAKMTSKRLVDAIKLFEL
jgi:integrase